jgi:hypothetical protein
VALAAMCSKISLRNEFKIHSLVGKAGIRVHLLENLVDVGGVSLLVNLATLLLFLRSITSTLMIEASDEEALLASQRDILIVLYNIFS